MGNRFMMGNEMFGPSMAAVLALAAPFLGMPRAIALCEPPRPPHAKRAGRKQKKVKLKNRRSGQKTTRR
jgi:hypothetical protein